MSRIVYDAGNYLLFIYGEHLAVERVCVWNHKEIYNIFENLIRIMKCWGFYGKSKEYRWLFMISWLYEICVEDYFVERLWHI